MLKNLRILIVDSQTSSRAQIREILKNVVFRLKLEYASNFKVALEVLEGEETLHSVIVSSLDDKASLVDFLEKARHTKMGATTSFLVALRSTHQDSSYVADLYLHGVHGFICQPYSADEFAQLLQSAHVPTESEREDPEKAQRTLEFLMANSMRIVDLMANQMINKKKRSGYLLKELQEVTQSLAKMREQIGDEKYEAVFIDCYQKAKPSGRTVDLDRVKHRAAKVIHPGEKMRKLMETRNLSVERLLKVVSMEEQEFTQILEEQMPITKDIAEAVARAFGQNASYWLNLQKKYDEANPPA